MKISYKKIRFKISAPTWNEFELPDRSYFVSDIQDYFDYIIRKHEIGTDNTPVRIYVNKKENRFTSKIRTGYYLEIERILSRLE